MDLFKDLIPNILTSTKPIDFMNINSEYNSYMVNQALSYHMDCIFYAAEMNRAYNLDKQLQYDFYFCAIKKKKRSWTPWNKKQKSEDLDVIKKHFAYSTDKAKEVLNIITEKDLMEIKKSFDEGGINKK